MITADAVVIGAGCAGLSAATALAKAGVRVTVVEARPIAGGRTFATQDRVSGDWVDNGQHVLFGCYHDTLTYLDRIGARDRLRVQSALAVPMIDAAGLASELRCPALPSPWQLLAGVLAWSALPWRDRVSVAGVASALGPSASPPPPGQTVREWLEAHGQSQRLCELLWEPLALAALNEPMHRATATTFVEVIRRMLGSGPDDAALVLPAESLSHTFVDPALAYLASRDSTLVSGATARLVVDDGKVAGVDVRGERLASNVVVSAVPWHQLSGLFDVVPDPVTGLVDRASAMRSVPIVTVNLWFDRDVLDTPFAGLPGRTFQWAFDKRAVAPGHATHISLVCSAADAVVERTNEELVTLALAELAAALPAAARAGFVRGTAVRERRATFSLAADQPARPATVTPLPGFLLAGDWTDTGLPATIESAVVSGHRAAHEALELLRGPSR